MTLNQYLEKYGLTHQALADKLGLSRPYIGRLLNGQRKPEYAVKMLIQGKTRGAVNHEADWD